MLCPTWTPDRTMIALSLSQSQTLRSHLLRINTRTCQERSRPGHVGNVGVQPQGLVRSDRGVTGMSEEQVRFRDNCSDHSYPDLEQVEQGGACRALVEQANPPASDEVGDDCSNHSYQDLEQVGHGSACQGLVEQANLASSDRVQAGDDRIDHSYQDVEQVGRGGAGPGLVGSDQNRGSRGSAGSVSYTHLTLPTIYSV